MITGLMKAAKFPAPPNGVRSPAARQPPAVPLDPWEAGVFRLLEMPALEGFTPPRWRRLCLDCAALLSDWGAEMRRLGWSVEDAFGIHPTAPGVGVHCSGLGVLLNGAKVTAMTETAARITRPNGVLQSFTRKPMHGAVPVWTVDSNLRGTPHAVG